MATRKKSVRTKIAREHRLDALTKQLDSLNSDVQYACAVVRTCSEKIGTQRREAEKVREMTHTRITAAEQRIDKLQLHLADAESKLRHGTPNNTLPPGWFRECDTNHHPRSKTDVVAEALKDAGACDPTDPEPWVNWAKRAAEPAPKFVLPGPEACELYDISQQLGKIIVRLNDMRMKSR